MPPHPHPELYRGPCLHRGPRLTVNGSAGVRLEFWDVILHFVGMIGFSGSCLAGKNSRNLNRYSCLFHQDFIEKALVFAAQSVTPTRSLFHIKNRHWPLNDPVSDCWLRLMSCCPSRGPNSM